MLPEANDASEYKFLNKEEFNQLLKTPSFSRDFLDNDVLCKSWYPYFLSDKDAIQHLFKQQLLVLLEGSMDKEIKSLSIFSPLYMENIGCHRSTLNLFFPKSNAYKGNIKDSVLNHITLQISKLMEMSLTVEGPHYFEIFAQEEVIDVVLSLIKGEDIKYFVRNNQGRAYDTMYIYLKSKIR